MTIANQSLTQTQLESRLDEALDLEINRFNPEKPAKLLVRFNREEQKSALHWCKIAGKGLPSIGYCVAEHIDQALDLMEPEQIGDWVYHALDLYDRKGLMPAMAVIRGVRQYALEAKERAQGIVFEEISAMLGHFVCALSGRQMKIEVSEAQENLPWTDTEKIYLPSFVGRLEDKEKNRQLYKIMMVFLWAQNRFGTWRVQKNDDENDSNSDHNSNRNSGENSEKNLYQSRLILDQVSKEHLPYFLALETIRLEAKIAQQLPGVYRQMKMLLEELNETIIPENWKKNEIENFEDLIFQLQKENATEQISLKLLPSIVHLEKPERLAFQGILNPQAVREVLLKRVQAEREEFEYLIWKMQEESQERKEQSGIQNAEIPEVKFDPMDSEENEPEVEDSLEVTEITIDGAPIAPPERTLELASSILQDFSQIPEEYLHPAGPGNYDPHRASAAAKEVWGGTYHEEGAFFYDEWDYQRLNYRKGWCVLREMDVASGDPGFVPRTLEKYRAQVAHLRKSFEALRGEEKLLRRQENGDDLDLEAVVEAWADAHLGMEMPDRLYTRMAREERSIAVLFAVDMSGSTRGWVNEVEREALVLLCEALETLGDRYAIYGFSGWARKRCEIFPVKTFENAYVDDVHGKIAGIDAQDYTRMGVATRHLTAILNGVEAKTRILITLSDGKPDDSDGYAGQYGIEDTRMALIEARRVGVHPFCITIDTEGQEYLPHLYGQGGYVVVDDVATLPFKVADIYRRLTS